MGKLQKGEVEHVAKLAKLDLSEKELKKFTNELSRILDYVSQLNEVDTIGVEPTSQTTGLENIEREDKTKPDFSLTQDRALSGTDKILNGNFVVPGILDNK